MPSVGAVAQRYGPAYLARHEGTILPSHRRALRDLAACRTAALGGHVSRCDECGYEHYAYHSCRNRSCPECHGATTARWLAARERELLPVSYFHVVFTLPAALRELVRTHQRVLLDTLMATAAESLQALAADPHYVGGTLGILAVLHTWTRALVYHPHVHCLVPAGALAPDHRTWRPARGTFLVPVRALSVHFRARFLARLSAQLPEVVVPAIVWERPWVVYCKPSVQGSTLVLRYLARYVHRVAITNARILTIANEQVVFRYQDRRAAAPARWRTMTLPAHEFLRRFLQHVLPRGFHKIRYYGFWCPAAASVRAQLRRQLALPSSAHHSDVSDPPANARIDWACPAHRCPQCDRGPLRVVRRIPRHRTIIHSSVPP